MNLKHILFLEKDWTRQVSKTCPPRTDQKPELSFKLAHRSVGLLLYTIVHPRLRSGIVGRLRQVVFHQDGCPTEEVYLRGVSSPRMQGLDAAASRNLSDALEGLPSGRGSAAATGHTATKGLPRGPGRPPPRPYGRTCSGQS